MSSKRYIFLVLGCVLSHISYTADKLPRSVAYEILKNNFKEQLFQQQQGLMNRDAYLAFIEPYLNQAEQELVIPQKIAQLSDVHEYQGYFDGLAVLNKVMFGRRALPKSLSSDR